MIDKDNKKAHNPKGMMLEDDTFCFECHPSVACYTICCSNPDMYLYPYDIIRMKNHLDISSDEFLEKYTFSALRDNPYFPNLMLKIDKKENRKKSCPFLAKEGCSIYEDRPFSCRAYPLERAVARVEDSDDKKDCYFMARHSHCLGHDESRSWTVREWIQHQGLIEYNQMNDLWVDIDTIFRNNPWGERGINSPALKMAFMACFNIDRFREFVFKSSFLTRFDISEDRIHEVKESDLNLMVLGFDWIKLFLKNTGPLKRDDEGPAS